MKYAVFLGHLPLRADDESLSLCQLAVCRPKEGEVDSSWSTSTSPIFNAPAGGKAAGESGGWARCLVRS